MKKLVSELIGEELNYWVAMAEGWHIKEDTWISNTTGVRMYIKENWTPSTNPAQAWMIIERNRIAIYPSENSDKWCATLPKLIGWNIAETGLIAAMRCYVASVYGEYVGDDDE